MGQSATSATAAVPRKPAEAEASEFLIEERVGLGDLKHRPRLATGHAGHLEYFTRAECSPSAEG